MDKIPEMILQTIEESIEAQKGKLLRIGQEFIPNLTPDDVLQPMDYPILENNPYFRYEEGVLAGMQTMRAAFLSIFKIFSN